MSLKKQAISSVFWTSLQQFSNQGVSFIVSLSLARLLMPAEFGLIALISIFISIGKSLMDVGLNQSLIRSSDVNKEDFDTVFIFNLIGSITIYILIFLLAPLISDFYHQPLLTKIVRVYSLVIVINAFDVIQTTQLIKSLKFKTQMKISVPSLIIGGATGITLAYNGFGVWSLVWSGIIQSATAAIQLWFWSDWRPSLNFSKAKFKEHFHFGYKLTLSSLLDTIFNNIYTILIGKFFAPAMVGFYNRADTLKQLPVTNIGSILNKVTFPLFSKVQHDDVVLKNLYKKLMLLVIYIVAPIILFMSALAEPLFRLLFTEKWLPAVPYFQILCWNGILYPIHGYNLNILKVKGRSDLFLKLEITKKIIISLMIIFSFQFGIYGLLYSSVMFSFVGFFINTYYSGPFINYKSWEQIKDIMPTILLATACAVLIYFFDTHFQTFFHYDFLRLMIGSMFGVVVYISVSLVFKIQSLIELINIIKRK